MLFGLDIAQVVADALADAGGLEPTTLVVVTPGARDPSDPTRIQQEQTVDYACQGMVEEWGAGVGLVNRVAAKVLLVAKTIAGGTVAPKIGDRIVIHGVTHTIGTSDNGKPVIETDPALATYSCRVRAGT